MHISFDIDTRATIADGLKGKFQPAQKTPAGTLYSMQVSTGIMSAAGVDAGDTVVVDRLRVPADGNIIIADLDGELVIRCLKIENRKLYLEAPGAGLALMEMAPPFFCWGVVVCIIKPLLL